MYILIGMIMLQLAKISGAGKNAVVMLFGLTAIVYACESLEKLPKILSNAQLRAKGKFIINPQI